LELLETSRDLNYGTVILAEAKEAVPATQPKFLLCWKKSNLLPLENQKVDAL